MAKRNCTLMATAFAVSFLVMACNESNGPAGLASFSGDNFNDGALSAAAVQEIIDFEDESSGDQNPVVFGDGGSGPIATSASAAAAACEQPPLAIIYDTTTDTADPDLNNQPLSGNVLIVEEDLSDADGDGDPDDCANGGTLVIDFSGVDAGGVEVASIDVLDIENDNPANDITLLGPGDAFISSTQIPVTGDGGIVTVNLGPTSGVVKIVVSFETSGAIDNIAFTPPMGGTQGCTPGKWKNWTGLGNGNQANVWAATSYVPGQTVDSVFTGFLPSIGSLTLLEALGGGGGPGLLGKQRILVRAAVAALLNGSHPNVDYPLTDLQVIAQVNAAVASGDEDTILDLADELDGFNNDLPCPEGDLTG